MMGREWLSGADNAWRRLGTPENLTTITGVLTFAEPLDYDVLCRQLDERLLRFDRFTQRLGGRKRTIRRPYWTDVEEFDIETHVHDINLRSPNDSEQLQRFVGRLMSRPLDERQPLWEAYLLEEFQGGSALVFRLHHSIADGFALLSVLFGLADEPQNIQFPIDGLSVPDAPKDRSGSDSADDSKRQETVIKADASRSTDGQRRPAVDHSPSPREQIRRTIRLTRTTLSVGKNLLMMDSEPQTSLHDDLGVTKRAAWTDEYELQRIKRIARATDTTINDVLLGATAGVFRRTLDQRDEDTDNLVLRCTVPVNLKPLAERDENLGNYFGMAFVPIPVGIEPLDERIEFIRERTSRHRLGTEAFLIYSLLTLGGHVPESVFNLALGLFEDNATAVVSNVPGPVNSIDIAGVEVENIMFWNPQAVDQGLSLSIFSYDGGVRVGISGDVNVIPDPEQLTAAFESEMEALEATY